MGEPEVTTMPPGFTPVVPYDRCLDARYGLELVADDVEGEGVVSARVPVSDSVRSEHGFVHGGLFAVVAETLASRGTALTVMLHGLAAMGQANDTDLLEPVSGGVLHFEARVLSRRDEQWLWTAEARDDAGRLCAFSRVTVAVRPMRPA